MKTIIKWLLEIEQQSADTYLQAAKGIREPQIKNFLNHLADDEARHFRIMQMADQAIRQNPDLISDIALDDETKGRIERRFKTCQRKLNDQSATLETIIDCIVETEFSEWNPIFLYVLNVLKNRIPEFKPEIAEMQRHLRQIEHFLSRHPYGKQKVKQIRKITPVWKENILIVDDEPEIVQLLAEVLKSEGVVATAPNGKIGLEKIRKTYYRLIISDVDMPVMNGFDLYRRASAEYANIWKRFIFYTGSPSSESIEFFNRHKLQHLIKPVNIHEIRSLVLKTMHEITTAN